MDFHLFFVFSFLTFCSAYSFPSRHENTPKIIGGENVTINQVPYQLSLQYNGSHVCGASIIGRFWALTAAHCLLGDFGYYDIRSGTDQLNQGGRLHPATFIYINPNFDTSNADYDVALIRTYEPFDFGDTRQPISLTTVEPEKGSDLFVSGWGHTEEDGSSGLPTQLQGVSVPYVDRETCKNLLTGLSEITDRMICAGAEGKDSCSEDSGGPLVLNNTQVGVVSFGIGCGQANRPGVYTNLANSEIQDWIKNVTEF